MKPRLIPLSIPSGWAVILNSFGDEDPVVEDGAIVNDHYFSEDLLLLRSLRRGGSDWIADPEGFVLDLGWYPESKPNGAYRATLTRVGQDKVLGELKSRDRYTIKSFIERCLLVLAEAREDTEISRAIAAN
jgi:hypothetical protein